MSKAKRNALLLLSAATLLMLLLAMAMPSLDLAPGQPFTLEKTEVVFPGTDGPIPSTQIPGRIFQGLLGIALVLLPVYVVYSLFSARGRKRLLRFVVTIVLLFLVAQYLADHPIDMGGQQETAPEAGAAAAPADVPVAAFAEDEAPAWLTVVVILITAAFSLALLWAIFLLIRQSLTREEEGLDLDPLGRAAHSALTSLQEGGDFGGVIIRCYHEMNRVVRQQRDLAREAAMTPREFEMYLINRGLPRGAVETLTRLFERARYGGLSPEAGDERLASACLTEIVNLCRTVTGGAHE